MTEFVAGVANIERIVLKCIITTLQHLVHAHWGDTTIYSAAGGGGGDGKGAPIHMSMIRLETAENHRLYCLMPSDNFIVKNSGLKEESNVQSLGYRQ